jgi:RNA polymerase sigma factor (sigma-70 family)
MSDAELIAAVRDGDSEAYGVLYERHLYAAKRAASCLVNTAAEREDLVADAFLRVLRALRDGGGPNAEFRAYLLVTMRNAAISTARGAAVAPYADVPEAFLPQPAGDPMMNHWNAMTVALAFATLPERWRTVLWHTEVEEETPAEVAPLLGMRPNGVAALAYRAREGLRQAYLRAHLSDVEAGECRATVSKLAGWVRRSVPVPLGRKISHHLAVCSDCRARADTLSRVNEELRVSVAPVLLGAAFAAAYAPVAAPVAGAVKSVLAKLGVAAMIAATAVTVSASGPSLAVRAPEPPVVVQPTMRTDSIEGPAPDSGSAPRVPDTGVPTTVTPEPAAVTETPAAPTTGTAGTKADKEAAKADKKADKQAAKDAKTDAKESKKAEKGK